jgi:hypothetical protein
LLPRPTWTTPLATPWPSPTTTRELGCRRLLPPAACRPPPAARRLPPAARCLLPPPPAGCCSPEACLACCSPLPAATAGADWPPALPACRYGTHVLLEACRVYGGIRRFLCISTDEVYGDTSVGAHTGG